jgi:hypothetical protein
MRLDSTALFRIIGRERRELGTFLGNWVASGVGDGQDCTATLGLQPPQASQTPWRVTMFDEEAGTQDVGDGIPFATGAAPCSPAGSATPAMWLNSPGTGRGVLRLPFGQANLGTGTGAWPGFQDGML